MDITDINTGVDIIIAITFGIPSSLLEKLYVNAIEKLKNNPSPKNPYTKIETKILSNNVL